MRQLRPLALALWLSACSPGGESLPAAVVAVLGPTAVAVSVGDETVGTVQLESVALDRVEASWSEPAAAAAVVVHHGRRGGATLRVVDSGGQRVLLATDPHEDLSAPLWSEDGDGVVVVRSGPYALRGATLSRRGELWQVALEGSQQRLAINADDAARPVGWDRQGRLLFARHGGGDLSSESLSRLDPRTGRLEDLIPADAFTPGQARGFKLIRRGDAVVFVRSDQPMVTAPGPAQVVEVVVVDLAHRDRTNPRVVAREVGAMPVGFRGDGPTLRYRLEGTGLVRTVDLANPAVTNLQPLPPAPLELPNGLLCSSLSMPYVHQVYDTPDDFNGNWACGPTSTLMAVQHFGRLPKWPITVNTPSAHNSDYGAYVAYKYTAFGHTFDRVQNDASGKAAQGAYGWCTDGGAAWAWRMQDYAKLHQLSSDFSGSVSFSKVEAELNAGKVVVLSTQLTSAGHIITVKGTSSGNLVTNDPYGDRNLPSYPNAKGEGAVYTWAKVAAKWYITVFGTPTQTTPEYKAKVVDLTYPHTMAAGSTGTASVKVQNEGIATWDTSDTRLGTTEPRDRASEFFTAGDWLGKNRPAAADTAAKPSETATFSFTLTAPTVCQEQEYTEHFNLLQEQVAWFSDSGQGGPTDTEIALTIKVTPVDSDGDGATTCDDCDDANPAAFPGATEVCNGIDDDCDGETDEGLACDGDALPRAAGDGGPPVTPWPRQASHAELQGGCSLSGDLPPPPGAPLLLLVLLVVVRRRRV